MKVIVTGTRHDLTPPQQHAVAAFLDNNVPHYSDHTLIHGDAPGVDTFLGLLAKKRGWTVEAFSADWKLHGRAAGPIRNQRMVDAHPDADLVLGFPAPDSRGTWDMLERAARAHIPMRVFLLR